MVMPQYPQYVSPLTPVTPPVAPIDTLQDAVLTITKKGQSLSFDLETRGFAHTVLQNLDFGYNLSLKPI